MADEELVQPDIEGESLQDSESIKSSEPPARTSRIDRLKRKLKKLQGKDPDIYPMW